MSAMDKAIQEMLACIKQREAKNKNLKKRTKQLSAAARAIQTRKRDMLTDLYYARAFLTTVDNNFSTACALAHIDHAIKIGEM